MSPHTGQRGSVSLMTALLAPVMMMMLALAIEVTLWSLSKVELQRIADIAAWAGGQQYAATGDAQASAAIAIDLAELNGVSGAAFRRWNANTLTMTDNLSTAQIVAGIRNTGAQAIKVGVSRVVAISFARIFPGALPFLTIAASSTVEVGAATGLPGCVLALSRAEGTAATLIAMSDSAKVTALGCSVRANGAMALSGSSIIKVPEIYASGSIVTSDTAYVSGKVSTNAPQTLDPMAGYAQLQTALSSLPQGGSAVVLSGSSLLTIDPGSYSGIDVSGSAILTLNSGLYTVSGNVSLAGSSILAGSQVSILTSGSLTVVGSTTISATQPDAASTAGGIPGILFASKAALPSSISGSATIPRGGTFYYPNGDFALSGSFAAGNSGCMRLIASKVSMSGSASITTDCASGSEASAGAQQPTIAFVQ